MTHSQPPTLETAACALETALGQVRFARQYTLELLNATPQELWFRIPDGLPTHVAWQAGHLAVSQYGLLLFRIRGRQPEDLTLIPGKFRKAFGRGSTPVADPAGQPTPDELLQRLDQVWQQAAAELSELDPAVLLEPVDMPWAVWPIKLGAVLFCPLHEQIHAGQIGLLRRALQLSPVR